MSKENKAKNILANLKKGDKKLDDIHKFSEEYKSFLSENKLERECVMWGVEKLEKEGFVDLNKSDISPEEIIKGKFYITFNNVSLIAFDLKDVKELNGFNIIMSHVDSPRLDIKPNPVYEEEQMTLLKTQYYGGIKKYQWTTIPLALRGVVIKRDGTLIKVNIGDNEGDPVFTISDLLPHLGKEQREKTLDKAILGEDLNAILGSQGSYESKNLEIKKGVLDILSKEYNIEEKDFISSDLSFVPAGRIRDLGVDRSLLLGYGHDDKVCAYTSFQGFLDSNSEIKSNNMLVWVTREETGSDGVGAAQDKIIEYSISRLCEVIGSDTGFLNLSKILRNSTCLSADVDAIMDPNYSSVYDKLNSARLNNGVIITKYTGSGGKYYTSEASAELISKIVNIFEQNNITWQNGLLGKVDQGGGGTIAMYMANRGVSVIDCGPGVLSMHAPYEVIAKADVYETYLAYKAFYLS